MKDYSLKAFKEKFKNEGIFYTPELLARTLLNYVDIEYKNAYDPTCGRGNLLKVLADDIKKYGQEKNEEELNVAKNEVKNFEGFCGDTLIEDGFKGIQFDLILANPPFSIKWDSAKSKGDERFTDAPCVPTNGKADYAFILHMIHKVKEDGLIVALNFPGILYRGNREGKIRKWLIEKNYIDKVISVPPNLFEDTKISTCILVMRKNKKTTDVVFEDLELEESRVVKYEEIEENGFALNVSLYITKEEEKEIINPTELNETVREGFKLRLRTEIKRDKEICNLNDLLNIDYDKDTKSYCDELIKIIEEERAII